MAQSILATGDNLSLEDIYLSSVLKILYDNNVKPISRYLKSFKYNELYATKIIYNKNRLRDLDRNYIEDNHFDMLYVLDDITLIDIAKNMDIASEVDRIKLIRLIIDKLKIYNDPKYDGYSQQELNQALIESVKNSKPYNIILLLNKGLFANQTNLKVSPLVKPISADIHFSNDEPLRLAARRKPLLYDWEKSAAEENEINTDIVKILLFHEADIHVEDDIALRLATSKENEDIAQVLIIYGANVHAKNNAPVVLASANGLGEVVRNLIEFGADIRVGDDAPFRFAAKYGQINVVKILLQKGANIHAKDDYALREASKTGGYESLVKLLLEKGADVHANNDQALQNAAKSGSAKMVKTLLEYGANDWVYGNKALRNATLKTLESKDDKDKINVLLEYGADIHVNNDEALRYASERNDPYIMKFLLSRGANINVLSPDLIKQYSNI